MASSPDPLFRNGLEHYRKPAPASVWDRIESGLDRKRRKSIWLKVAAGLCLLIAASTVLWQYDQANTVETQESVSSQLSAISYQSSPISPLVPEEESIQSPNSSSIVERSRNNHSDIVHEGLPVVERSRNEPLKGNQQSSFGRESSVACTERSRSMSREVAHSPNKTQLISMVETDELLATPASDIQIENSTEEWVKDVAAAQKSIIISYSSEEVNEKFLKKELIAEATPAKKSTSGLQKVIDKALDLTNEGTVYGELREKKNEWLSLNILSNKAETNK